MTAHLYPRLDPDQFGAGQLTKVRAQAVSGPACAEVAERLGLPERLLAASPAPEAQHAMSLVRTERVLASVCEAAIGACHQAFGFEETAAAVVDAFAPEIAEAIERSVDFKSELQERLARRGAVVEYAVEAEEGPPHDRVFVVTASVDGKEIGRGAGRSKKAAEQAAAQAALGPEAGS